MSESLKEAVKKVSKKLEQLHMPFVSWIEVQELSLTLVFSSGPFTAFHAGVTYAPVDGVNNWSKVLIPSSFYGLKARTKKIPRPVFLINHRVTTPGVPKGVYCWPRDEELVKRLFDYAPLEEAIADLPEVAVLPRLEDPEWLELRPLLPPDDMTLVRMAWLGACLNLAFDGALNQRDEEKIVPLVEAVKKVGERKAIRLKKESKPALLCSSSRVWHPRD